jgi:hypothetical protein
LPVGADLDALRGEGLVCIDRAKSLHEVCFADMKKKARECDEMFKSAGRAAKLADALKAAEPKKPPYNPAKCNYKYDEDPDPEIPVAQLKQEEEQCRKEAAAAIDNRKFNKSIAMMDRIKRLEYAQFIHGANDDK